VGQIDEGEGVKKQRSEIFPDAYYSREDLLFVVDSHWDCVELLLEEKDFF
jgi:hypothetical protein